MKLQKPPRPVTSLPLSIHMIGAVLYEPQPIGAPQEVACSPPALEVSTDVMQTLWSLGTKLTEFHLHGFLLAHRAKLTKNTLQVNDVQWHSSSKPLFGGQFSIPLRYCRSAEVQDQLVALGESTAQTPLRTHAGRKDPIQPVDLLRVECYLTSENHQISLHFLRVWPSVSLTFQPIAPLRIVSTELAVRLIKEKREDNKFRTGLLTMDKAKRLILLRTQDPHLPELSLVGLWLSGLPKSKPDSCAQLLWSSCIHYLLSFSLHRLSNSPLSLSFLLLITNSPLTLYEVTTRTDPMSRPGWLLSTATLLISGTEPGDMTVPLRFGESLRNSVSSEASTRTSEDSSHKLQSSAEDLIKEQTMVLKDLERQLTVLKQQMFTTAVPQTARSRGEKGRMSLAELGERELGAYTDRKGGHSGLHSPRHVPGYSLPVSRRSPPRDVVVPSIEYRSESDTSEDSEVRLRH